MSNSWENARPYGEKPIELIDVGKLERRTQALENRVVDLLRVVESQGIRLDIQASQIADIHEALRASTEKEVTE